MPVSEEGLGWALSPWAEGSMSAESFVGGVDAWSTVGRFNDLALDQRGRLASLGRRSTLRKLVADARHAVRLTEATGLARAIVSVIGTRPLVVRTSSHGLRGMGSIDNGFGKCVISAAGGRKSNGQAPSRSDRGRLG